MSIDNAINQHGLEEVAHLMSGDWEWSSTDVYFQRSSERFFVYTDAGCSCYGWGDGFQSFEESFEHATREQAMAAIQSEAMNDSPGAWQRDDVQREVAKVRDFR